MKRLLTLGVVAGAAVLMTGCFVVGPGAMASYTVQPQPAPYSCQYMYSGGDPLPDPNCTPGAIDPQVTQANIGSTICQSGYTASVRPPENITNAEKAASALAYGYNGSFQTGEYDHLIPLELGGDPNDPANLWVEPNDVPGATSTHNSKDVLENQLNSLVCSGQISLFAAQLEISSNWVNTYQTFVGPLPSPTPPPPPPPPGSCSASISNPTPGDGGDETVSVSSGVPNAAGTVNVHYKTTTHPFSFQTDSSGNAQVTFNIGHPTVGYQVIVDVVLPGASCSTAFTPQ